MVNDALAIRNGRIYTPDRIIDDGTLLIENGRISDLGRAEEVSIPPRSEDIDATGLLICPGFIDIHVNGGGGSMAIDGTYEAIRAMAMAHSRFGTTGMLPTTISASDDSLAKTLRAIREGVERGAGGARILGAHLEGPFLSPDQKGAHRAEYLQLPSVDKFDDFQSEAGGNVVILSLAPELQGASKLVRHATKAGVRVSLAHSNADFQQTTRAIKEGVALCAHLFNGMPGVTARAPGPVVAFLTIPQAMVELLPDGVHVHPPIMEVVIGYKGTDKVILVTDAVTPAGTSMKSFNIDGLRLYVQGNTCYLKDGTLAGSALTMNRAVSITSGVTRATLHDALMMASLNPARLLGIDHAKGSLEVGKDADVVIADEEVNVKATVVEGRVVFEEL